MNLPSWDLHSSHLQPFFGWTFQDVDSGGSSSSRRRRRRSVEVCSLTTSLSFKQNHERSFLEPCPLFRKTPNRTHQFGGTCQSKSQAQSRKRCPASRAPSFMFRNQVGSRSTETSGTWKSLGNLMVFCLFEVMGHLNLHRPTTSKVTINLLKKNTGYEGTSKWRRLLLGWMRPQFSSILRHPPGSRVCKPLWGGVDVRVAQVLKI